ncbi:DNA polymerase EPSILON CATALYTIC SUBUNIT A [Salix koriyanagi]|uniref:DNA polymerase EPSILON CATALYTIC SUBUNIT A n=1 Tax=Salix koriyanagi TaxID=2511006 RepID=A0A9Q0QM41_9ROSI|nr:DNA polymerase EPSILON CATALYTIC SUBUNIT A [Salix koriyanagi]
MGSLMPGWDSPISDPKSVKYERNSSLTKGEIDDYWKSNKKTEEDHLKASNQDSIYEDDGVKFQRSTCTPDSEELMDVEDEPSLEHLIKKNGWWASSKWAFLNEPPAPERAFNNYTPQFNTASLAASQSTIGASAV